MRDVGPKRRASDTYHDNDSKSDDDRLDHDGIDIDIRNTKCQTKTPTRSSPLSFFAAVRPGAVSDWLHPTRQNSEVVSHHIYSVRPTLALANSESQIVNCQKGLWRNGSASDSRSEGWEFESLWPHLSSTREAKFGAT